MSILRTGIRLTRRGFLIITILYPTFLSWYYVFYFSVLPHVVGSSTEAYQLVGSSFNFVIVITLLLNSFFVQRFSKISIIYGVSLATSIVTILLLFTSSTTLRLIIIFVAGVFFAIGQLAFFTYFWSLTVSEERGRAAGLIGLFSLPISSIVLLMGTAFDFSRAVMLGVILSLGMLAIKLLRPERKAMLTAKNDERGYESEKRTILLYSVPWAVVTLINATLARNISYYVSQSVQSYMFLVILQLVGASLGALGGGIIADFFGRRLSLVFGLTLYGICSALEGFVENYEVLCFAYVASGLTWGIFLTVYLLVVWGDLGSKENCAKIYSIGLTIYYLTTGVGVLLTPQISQISLVTSSLVSCLLIFLSNIPLILAPELLSSDFREKIKLKLYQNALRKIRRRQSQNQG